MSLISISNTFDSVVRNICKILAYVASYCLLFQVFLVASHVFMRYFFGRPIAGAVELIEFTMVFVVFFGFGYGTYRGVNVAVEIVMERLPAILQHYAAILVNVFAMIIVTYILWQGAVQASILATSKQVSGVLHIAHYPFFWIMVLGYIVFDLAILNDTFKHYLNAIKK